MGKTHKQIMKKLSFNKIKRLPIGKYKHVYPYEMEDGTIVYQCDINRKKFRWTAFAGSEREAAKMVDLKLISKGFEPVNILKRI